MGRVVKTHSSYLKGLLEILYKLAESRLIGTITPGVITKVNGQSEKLKLKISRKTEYGYKTIARNGRTAQEVFIITKLTRKELENKIKKYIE